MLDSNSLTVTEGQTGSVGYSVVPASATVTALSNDETIATANVDEVNSVIEIEGHAAGSTTVEVTAEAGSSVETEEITVTVEGV